ncbi:MAG: hypothetical protein IIC33_10680, partial [Chloroflexi bacterium]|nr:hypothetical protein [Chloroflexota bacterium]
ELPAFNFSIAIISNVAAAVGIALASLLYLRRKHQAAVDLKDPLEIAGPLHELLTQKYYLDALYENWIVRRWFYGWVVGLADWLDRNLVDGLVDAVGGSTRNIGRAVALLQTGQVQFYGIVVLLGSLVILVGFLVLGSGL